jgi:hypothetical protein
MGTHRPAQVHNRSVVLRLWALNSFLLSLLQYLSKERELAEELDLLSPPPACPDIKKKKTKATTTKKKGKKAPSESEDEVDDDDDDNDDENARKPPRRYGWREFKEPALSLNVVGDFTPFAYFLSGPYGQKTHSFDTTYPCLDDNEEIFGSSSDIQASYCFRTVRRQHLPHLFLYLLCVCAVACACSVCV